jgi:hypothetical protein
MTTLRSRRSSSRTRRRRSASSPCRSHCRYQLKRLPRAHHFPPEPADPRRLFQRNPGLPVLRRRALSGLCRPRRDHRRGTRSGREARRLRSCRRRRHGALDHRRNRERCRTLDPRPHPVKADAGRPHDQPRHQHQPPYLPSRAAFGRKDLHGLGLVGLSRGPADRIAPAGRRRRCRRTHCDRRRYQHAELPLPDRRRQPALATAARLRRGAKGVHRVPARDCRGRDTPALGDRRRRWRAARQLPRGREPHDHRPAVRLGEGPQQIVRIVRTDGRA